MDTKRATVAAVSVHLEHKGKGKNKDQKGQHSKDQKGKCNQAGSVDDAGQTQEPDAETGCELGVLFFFVWTAPDRFM